MVREVVSEATEFHYQRRTQPLPRSGRGVRSLTGLLPANAGKPLRERLTLIRVSIDVYGHIAGILSLATKAKRPLNKAASTSSL